MKWPSRFAPNAWKRELGASLYHHRIGEMTHANVGDGDTVMDVPEHSVRRLALMDVQAGARRALSQSMAV